MGIWSPCNFYEDLGTFLSQLMISLYVFSCCPAPQLIWPFGKICILQIWQTSSADVSETLYCFKHFNWSKMPTQQGPAQYSIALQFSVGLSYIYRYIPLKSISRTFWENACLYVFDSWKPSMCGFWTPFNCPRNMLSLMTCSRTESELARTFLF